MKTSIATVCISGDLKEKLAVIASAGFDGVEIFENDFLAFDGTPAEVGRMIRDHGLEITLFQPFRDFEGMPEPAQWIAQILPLTHFNTIVRGVVLRGAELGDLAPALLKLTAFLVAAVTIAATRFRKRLG